MIYSDIPYIGPPKSYNSTSYPKRYIAIHNTSNDASDTNEAEYAKRRTDGVSSHYYVDSNSITQSLNTKFGANHSGSSTGNRHAIAYEITGVNSWTRQQWLDRVSWPLLTRQIARDCTLHAIAAQLLTVTQMKAGTPGGFVTHDQMRQAWGGTTHTDPGPNFPMDHLVSLVRAQLGSTPERIFAMGMMMLARDARTGQHWLCDGMTRRPVRAEDIDDIKYLGKVGALSVWAGTSPETSNSIWPDVSDIMGLPVVGGSTGGSGASVAEVRATMIEVINQTSLTA